MQPGDLVKINRQYGNQTDWSYVGILLEYKIAEWPESGPLEKVATVKILFTGGKVHELSIFRGDSVEKIQ